MSEYILALNCGSSSAKFNLFTKNGEELLPYINGIAEEIGNLERSQIRYKVNGEKNKKVVQIGSHSNALEIIFNEFSEYGISKKEICAVGHRVVHGGDKYVKSILIDDSVINTIRDLIPIAPLHNPPNLTGIREAVKLLPGIPQVAVFDTAFHGTIPEYAYRYAIPESWYKDYGVRRYGFHGTSHMYVSKRAARVLGIDYKKFNCITAHLGNGCSITKIVNGKSIDTSMGFTPLEGLIMGTRSGDIDPALVSHVAECLVEEKGLDEAEAFNKVIHALNKESGLKALGNTNMMQDIRTKALEGDEYSELVILIYAYRVAKYIGAYWATMPDTHAIVFTAGLGENEGYVRKKIMQFLGNLNITINEENNNTRGQELEIGMSNPDSSPVSIMVIPTDEEIMIGYDALYIGYLGESVPERYPFEK